MGLKKDGQGKKIRIILQRQAQAWLGMAAGGREGGREAVADQLFLETIPPQQKAEGSQTQHYDLEEEEEERNDGKAVLIGDRRSSKGWMRRG